MAVVVAGFWLMQFLMFLMSLNSLVLPLIFNL